jgi:hypothetical protein
VNYIAGSVTSSGAGSVVDPGEIKTIGGVEYWIEPDGYTVEMKFVRKYPALFGPLAVDPDKGQGDVECDDPLSKITAKLTGYGGTYSTWAERHCSLSALAIGINDVESSADVPPCPKFWLHENQYWVDHIAIGRLTKKTNVAEAASTTFTGILSNPRVLATIAAALTAGGVFLPTAAKTILAMVGIS